MSFETTVMFGDDAATMKSAGSRPLNGSGYGGLLMVSVNVLKFANSGSVPSNRMCP